MDKKLTFRVINNLKEVVHKCNDIESLKNQLKKEVIHNAIEKLIVDN